jgi:hypothetical protein
VLGVGVNKYLVIVISIVFSILFFATISESGYATVYESYVDGDFYVDESGTITGAFGSRIDQNTGLYYSTVINTSINITGAIIRSSYIYGGILTYGWVYANGFNYYAPYNLSYIKMGYPPATTGYLRLNNTVVNNGTSVLVKYYGEIGSTVYLNVSNVNVSLNKIYLNDSNNDGIYEGVISINTGNSGFQMLIANVSNYLGNKYFPNITIYVDHVLPVASVVINGNSSYTTSRFVTLSLNISDNFMMRDCKYSVDNNFNDDNFVTCLPYSSYVLNNFDGIQTVYVLVRDLAGNIISINDSINVDLVAPSLLITSPISYAFTRGTFDVTFTGAESATPQVSIDGNSFVTTTTSTYHTINSGLYYDGFHTVLVRDTNNSGLIGYSQVVNFVIDNVNPYIEFDYSQLTQNYYSNTNKIVLELFDSVSGINISSLNVTVNSGASSINVTNNCSANGYGGYLCSYIETNFLNQAQNTFNVTIKDRSQNSYKISIPIYSDTTKPGIVVNDPVGLKNIKSVFVNVTTNEAATCYYTSYYNGNNDTFDNILSAVSGTIHLSNYFASEGVNNLYFKCVDYSGNYNITNMSFNVIATYPSVTSISPSGFISNTSVLLNISTDKVVTCKYDSIDRDYNLMANTFSTTTALIHTQSLNVTQGLHYYFVRCKETNGLTMQQSVFVAFTVDSNKPYVVFEYPSSYSNTNSNFTRFIIYDSVSGVDNSSIKVTLNSGLSVIDVSHDCFSNAMNGYICEYDESYLDGLVIVTINATDFIQNKMSSSFSFTYDSVKPTITVNTLDDWYSGNTKMLNISVNEQSTCKYSDILSGNDTFDRLAYTFGGDLTKVTNAIVYTGYNLFYVTCRDISQNENYAIINFTVDNIVPAVSILNLPNATIVNESYWVSYVYVDFFGINQNCYISIDGDGWNYTASSPYLFNVSNYYDGVHTVQMMCNDSVNNKGYSQVATINIDSTPESVYILDAYNGKFLKGNVTFFVLGPDDIDYVNFFVSNGTTVLSLTDNDADFSFTFDTSSYSDGSYFLIAQGFDKDDYLIDNEVVSVVFDNSAPLFTIGLQNNSVLSGSKDISLSTSDNDIAKVDVSYSYLGTWYPLSSDYLSPFSFSWHTNLYNDGNYSLKIIAYDKTGFNSTLIITNLTLLNNKPRVNITSPIGSEIVSGIINVNFVSGHISPFDVFPISTEISIDYGTFISTTTSSSHTLDTNLFNDGQHLIIIKVNDSYGNVNYDSKLVTFFNVAQSIYFVEPDVSKNKYSGTINMEVITSSYTKKVRFEVFNSSNSLVFTINDTTSYDGFNSLYDTSLYSDGVYLLNATSYSVTGNYLASDSINVTFDNNINFVSDCDSFLVDKARLAIIGDSDLEYVLYEYYAGSGIYNIIGKAYTYPYQMYWYGSNVVNGNYTVRITGFDGVNTEILNTSVIVSKLSSQLSVDKTYVKNDDFITFTYVASGLNYNISINSSSFDSNSSLFYFSDDGVTNGDLYWNDGIYTGLYQISSSNTFSDGLRNATAIIVNAGQSFYSTVTFYLDNTIPNASLNINNGDNFTYAPSKAMSVFVVLTSNMSDNYGVDSCRFKNMYEQYGPWESCVYAKSFLLPSISSSGANNRTVYMDVKDYAGNIRTVSDNIFINFSDYDLALNDTTPPTAPEIYINNYTKSNFRVRWSQSFDRESFILLYQMRYCYTIGEDSSDVDESIYSDASLDYGCGAGYRLSGNYGHDEFADVASGDLGVDLNSSKTYYFKVKVFNGVGLFNYSNSSWFKVDGNAPSNVNFLSYPNNTFSTHNSTFVSGNSLYFKYSATDNVGVSGYYVSLDILNDTIPYDVTLNIGNITYNNMPSGSWYFHSVAIDFAGNIGNASHIKVDVDNTPPTTPNLLVSLSQSGTNISLSWTNSTDNECDNTYSCIEYYIVEMDDNSSFSSIDNFSITSDTNVFFSSFENKTYYVRVKAVDYANVSSAWSNYGERYVDTDAPQIIFSKKGGDVISYDVAYSMTTNEDAICYYKECASPSIWFEFSYTGTKNHGQVLHAKDGSGTEYCFKCEDAVGNILSPTSVPSSSSVIFTKVNLPTSFDISLTLVNTDKIYTGSSVMFNMTAYSGMSTFGEIDKDIVSLILYENSSDDGDVIDEFSLDDLGNGNYQISFYAPMKASSYDVVVQVNNILFPDKKVNIPVVSLNLDINYGVVTNFISGSGVNSSSQSEKFPYGISYANSGNHTLGIATETYPYEVSGDANNLKVSSRISDSFFSYIFMTTSNKNIQTKIPLLKQKTFDDEIVPSFGSGEKIDEKDVNTKIEYPDYILIGMNNIQDGSYEILIKKIGNDEITGKPIIEVSVK